MTGQQIQNVINAIFTDLQTDFKGFKTEIMIRNEMDAATILPISSDAGGNLKTDEVDAIKRFFDGQKDNADAYAAAYAPVQNASQAFRDVRGVHQTLIDTATAAREALADALEADADYQTAKAAYDAARTDPAYVTARDFYRDHNVSENYGNLQDARGKYKPA